MLDPTEIKVEEKMAQEDWGGVGGGGRIWRGSDPRCEGGARQHGRTLVARGDARGAQRYLRGAGMLEARGDGRDTRSSFSAFLCLSFPFFESKLRSGLAGRRGSLAGLEGGQGERRGPAARQMR